MTYSIKQKLYSLLIINFLLLVTVQSLYAKNLTGQDIDITGGYFLSPRTFFIEGIATYSGETPTLTFIAATNDGQTHSLIVLDGPNWANGGIYCENLCEDIWDVVVEIPPHTIFIRVTAVFSDGTIKTDQATIGEPDCPLFECPP